MYVSAVIKDLNTSLLVLIVLRRTDIVDGFVYSRSWPES